MVELGGIKIGDSRKVDYVNFGKSLGGGYLLSQLDRIMTEMGYESSVFDIDRNLVYTEELQKEISRHPESAGLKMFRSKGSFMLRSHNILAVINPEEEYNDMLFVRNLSSLTEIGEERMNQDFDELKGSVMRM